MDYRFTARQVVDLTGMRRPVLADLVKREVVTPHGHRGSGTGDFHIFDLIDVVGIAAVQRLRPKAETTAVLRSLFEFWRSAEGQKLVENRTSQTGIIVVDGAGRVAVEQERDISKLAALRHSAALFVIEPKMLVESVLQEVVICRMVGDHSEPSPAGREPRRRERTRRTPVPSEKHEPREKRAGSKKRRTKP